MTWKYDYFEILPITQSVECYVRTDDHDLTVVRDIEASLHRGLRCTGVMRQTYRKLSLNTSDFPKLSEAVLPPAVGFNWTFGCCSCYLLRVLLSLWLFYDVIRNCLSGSKCVLIQNQSVKKLQVYWSLLHYNLHFSVQYLRWIWGCWVTWPSHKCVLSVLCNV